MSGWRRPTKHGLDKCSSNLQPPTREAAGSSREPYIHITYSGSRGFPERQRASSAGPRARTQDHMEHAH